MKTYIHVNRNVIANNVKKGVFDPAITVKNYKNNTYAKWVRITGTIDILQENPECGIEKLNCGARVYMMVTDPNTQIEILK